jgi:hypothetical protein
MGGIEVTLKKDLSLFEVNPEELNPYEEHFLLENPFPGYGEPKFDVCTDQDVIKEAFVYLLRNFSSEAKRLRINGKNGAGKTNILLYFEQLTNEARRSKRIKNLYPIYVYAPGESYFDIHEQIVDKLAEAFLGDLLNTLQSDPNQIDALSPTVKPAGELLRVIKAITEPTQSAFLRQAERQEDALIRWMKGQKLSASDKKLLAYEETPPAEITNSSLAIRFLNGLLIVLKELNLCDGIVLLFDEFEEIFEGLTRAHQSRYAQDLRHLFDMLNESVLFVIATVPEPKDLAQYPAIERRLGNTVELQPIDSLELAIAYVSDYLNSGRDRYETYLKTDEKQGERERPNELKPLTREIVEAEYLSLKEEVEQAELTVLPGYFLPRMRERIKQIVEN